MNRNYSPDVVGTPLYQRPLILSPRNVRACGPLHHHFDPQERMTGITTTEKSYFCSRAGSSAWIAFSRLDHASVRALPATSIRPFAPSILLEDPQATGACGRISLHPFRIIGVDAVLVVLRYFDCGRSDGDATGRARFRPRAVERSARYVRAIARRLRDFDPEARRDLSAMRFGRFAAS